MLEEKSVCRIDECVLSVGVCDGRREECVEW